MAAQAKIDVEGIAKYVYPGNTPDSPKSFTYLPDGESYLLLGKDGKTIERYETATGKLLETVLDVSHTRENTIRPSGENTGACCCLNCLERVRRMLRLISNTYQSALNE